MQNTNMANINTTANTESQSAFTVTRRIGGTVYRAKIFTRQDGQEDMETKLLRMIRNDPEFSHQNGFQNDSTCGTIELPQMSCLA